MRCLCCAVAFAALLVAAIAPASGCQTASIDTKYVAAAAKPPDSTAYTRADVQAHFANQVVKYVEPTKVTFSCVDARGDDDMLSTPGGDFAELSDGIYLFLSQNGVKPNTTNISFIFRQYMDKVASPSRPFYYHTDEPKLAELFKAVGAAGIKPKPVIMPLVQPKDKKTADIWYKYLVQSPYQGCGHIRLMIYNPTAYGISSNYIPSELISQFFQYWWPTPVGSPERAKVLFSIKRGPLVGKAVVVANNQGPVCKGRHPLVSNAEGGSSLFVYHQTAAAQMRAQLLTPFFEGLAKSSFFTGKPLAFDRKKFTDGMEKLAAKQLDYTIKHLAPADSIKVFTVGFNTKTY